ncbi:MAG: pyruvate formate lyase family protein, partial [Lentisphaeria bacterium]
MNAWKDFQPGKWQEEINVRDFVQTNYTPYEGDASFLAGPTEATKALWSQVCDLMKIEREKGILDAETRVPSTITSHGPGYLNKDLEQIVGFQTDAPLKRGIMPNGGLRMVQDGLEAYGLELAPEVAEIFTKYRKTHNNGVFDIYTAPMRAARKSGIITGLPDAYGRGRIIGDYRRLALYGADRLMEDKKVQKEEESSKPYCADVMQQVEELSEQIKALAEVKAMGATYGLELGRAAANAKEAVQWTYMAYLAAVKEQNGAAMSLGRVSNFLDVYIQRDLEAGVITEEEAQEYIDHFVMKLRMVRFLRTPAYDELFSGDPTWVTESIGGMSCDGRPQVTKTSMRFMHTLYNLGPAPEPNITVLWSEQLPVGFKKYCAKVSIETSSIQYENDDN